MNPETPESPGAPGRNNLPPTTGSLDTFRRIWNAIWSAIVAFWGYLKNRRYKVPSAKPGTRNLIFGVILPAITIVIEVTTHFCGSVFFDPIPTTLHLVAVASVPLVNLFIHLRFVKREVIPPRWMIHLNAFTLGVAFFYALIFLPLAAMGIPALLFFGMGLLPMTPVFTWIATLRLRNFLKGAYSSNVKIPQGWPGCIAGVCFLIFASVHEFAVIEYAKIASSENAAARQSALKTLRWLNGESVILRACYGTQPWLSNILRMRASHSEREEFGNVYYRLTGIPFYEARPPAIRSWFFRPGDGFDGGLGGDEVLNKVRGLTLESSDIETVVTPGEHQAYQEWTFLFKNDASFQSEARAKIELPPGAVVSRLTLWIKGEPREAAFGGREQTRNAYTDVAVKMRKDPVLVTTAGKDRIMMQCFPIEPNGGTMKLRIGVTVPVVPRDRESAILFGPKFLETNFVPGKSYQQNASTKGDAKVESVVMPGSEQDTTSIWGTRLAKKIQLTTDKPPVFSDDPEDPAFCIRQTVENLPAQKPSAVVFVIDGSEGMKTPIHQLTDIITSLPDGVPFNCVFAGEQEEALWGGLKASSEMTRKNAQVWLMDKEAGGGQDNIPALTLAWKIASAAPHATIIWIHGPQPLVLSDTHNLCDSLLKNTSQLILYDLPVIPGVNRIGELFDSDESTAFQPLVSLPIAEALQQQFATWKGGATVWNIKRERIPASELPSDTQKASQHVTRLWAKDEVERLRATDKTAAMKLAVKMQLVTPVSGAVVLETKEQYDRHGLKPVDSDSVPMIPEPGSVVLLLLGGSALLSRRYRRK